MEPFAPKKLPSQAEKKPRKSVKSDSGFIPFSKVFQNVGGHRSLDEASDSPGEPGATSTVEYIEEEGVVKKIVGTCSCGEVTEIDCVYDAE